MVDGAHRKPRGAPYLTPPDANTYGRHDFGQNVPKLCERTKIELQGGKRRNVQKGLYSMVNFMSSHSSPTFKMLKLIDENFRN